MKLLAFISSLFLYSLSYSQLSCNNWLSTPGLPSYFEAGEIDIPGNQITVEAVFNRTTPYLGGLLYAGDLVSKHNTPSDANYLLRPNDAEITTSNGYFRTPDICEIELNKTYHVAMVYNGSTLKFYRNGFLMSQVPATGNLFQNAWKTRIGFYEPGAFNTNFIGYINEVRIWNIARTQAQIQANMNTSLSNPTTQTGLLGYYTFDNLQNKQGNTAYNGTLGGSASINASNPDCTLSVDSCPVIPVPGGGSVIINDYTPVISLDACTNNLRVEDASAFKTGDTVLLIQMKGAVVDSSNTASFGSIIDYKNAGNYEFNYVAGINGNTITLKNLLTRGYDLPLGKVQLIRVPYFDNYTTTDTLTCLPWDGKKGGVLVLNVKNNLTLNAPIDVSGRGFLGGQPLFKTNVDCNKNDFYYPPDDDEGGAKGEGICDISIAKAYGRGALANGGGGGNAHNSGGAGGANGGKGGTGGNQYQLALCSPIIPVVGGIGGVAPTYSNASNRIYLGGGGGAGHANDLTDKPGGNGGGIAIIISNTVFGNSGSILANGGNVVECTSQSTDCANDGHSGGGAGGTILLSVSQYNNPLTIYANGGKGADAWIWPGSVPTTGPGGGGGGGTVWFSNSSLPSQITVLTNGGKNGVGKQLNDDPWGATSGASGPSLYNLLIPQSINLYKKNIDSVRITTTIVSCSSFSFDGLAYTNNNGINSWQWSFDDGVTATNQNTSHTFSTSGNHAIKLTATDINGCKDSVTVNVDAGISPSSPLYTLTQPTCLNNFGSITVSSPLGSAYTYSIDGINYQSSTIFNQLAPATYPVTVKDLNTGCVSQPLSLTVTVNAGSKDMYLVPNAFTPNKDGLNECFGIKFWGVITEFKLIIYNRWGQAVFTTSNPNDCWNGIYKGQPVAGENYVYYVKAKTLCGPIEKKGNILLVR